MSSEYVHGYTERESFRLYDQASTLTELLHHDTRYPSGSRILEAGCGVGAQTLILAQNNPDCHFVSMDISAESIQMAKQLVDKHRITNVEFQQGDIFDLPFPMESFDHVFVCFVLEHLKHPQLALKNLRTAIKLGGSITIIEGDHGSTYFHPHSDLGMQTVDCLIKVQAVMGGNSLIGRQLYPLLSNAGFKQIHISPRMVYVDFSRPQLVEGFTKNTFVAMVEGVKEKALEMGLMDEASWQQGISDMLATASPNGTFCYTFFKGKAVKP